MKKSLTIDFVMVFLVVFFIALIFAGYFAGGVEQRYEAINYLNLG